MQMSNTDRTVRFWEYGAPGPVRISLRPGQTLSHCRSGRTEEGWSYVATRWSYEDGMVIREVISDGRDCDGRLATFATFTCPVEKLNDVRFTPESAIRYPRWNQISAHQRDYQAEAYGY